MKAAHISRTVPGPAGQSAAGHPGSAGLFQSKQVADFFFGDLSIFPDIIKHLLYLRGDRNNAFRRCRRRGIHIWQDNFEGIGGDLYLWLFCADSIQKFHTVQLNRISSQTKCLLRHRLSDCSSARPNELGPLLSISRSCLQNRLLLTLDRIGPSLYTYLCREEFADSELVKTSVIKKYLITATDC